MVELGTGTVVGTEVDHLPAAWWVDAHALLEEAAIVAPPGGPVHLDVSSSDLRRPLLVSSIARLPGSLRDRLVLDVTDREPIGLRSLVESPLAVLRQLGVRFAVEDFGEGWANLAMVDIVRPEVLKVSRARLIEDPRVARWVVDLARSLGAAAVVEALDSVEDWAWAVEVGFELGQGRLWSPGRRSSEEPGHGR